MPIRIVRLGSPRVKNEGLRIGTVRRPALMVLFALCLGLSGCVYQRYDAYQNVESLKLTITQPPSPVRIGSTFPLQYSLENRSPYPLKVCIENFGHPWYSLIGEKARTEGDSSEVTAMLSSSKPASCRQLIWLQPGRSCTWTESIQLMTSVKSDKAEFSVLVKILDREHGRDTSKSVQSNRYILEILHDAAVQPSPRGA